MEEKSIVEMLPFWDSLSEKEKQLVKSRAVIRPYKKGEMIQPPGYGFGGQRRNTGLYSL